MYNRNEFDDDFDETPYGDDDDYLDNDPYDSRPRGAQPEVFLKDYGFEQQKDEDIDIFLPKAFFDFESYHRQEKIKRFAISEEIFMIITESNKLYRWEIETNKLSDLYIPGTESGFSFDILGMMKNTLATDKKITVRIERVFLDPKGHHCIICTNQGDNYYIHKNSEKIRSLKTIRERVKSAIIDYRNSVDCCKVVFGTDSGKLISLKIDINLKHYDISESQPILITDKLGSPVLHLEFFEYVQQEQQLGKENPMRAVFALTGNYLYYFTGSRDFEYLFNKYLPKEPTSYMGFPLNPSKKNPLIDFHIVRNDKGEYFGNSVVVSDGNYIHFLKFPEKIERADYNPFSKMQTLKYAKKELTDVRDQFRIQELPIAIAASEHHYFILHKDCLTVLSSINEGVVGYYKGRDLTDTQRAIGMMSEKGDNIYIYDQNSIRTISLMREDQDVWKLYLENKKYQEAYEICRKNESPSLDYVAGLYADYLFEKKDYNTAAEIYTQTTRTFEEITLKFMLNHSQSALEVYLDYWLKSDLVRGDKMRRTILLNWILEYRLHVLNEKEREIKGLNKSERESASLRANNQFQNFIKTYQGELDENLTYSLLQSHGRFKEFVQFAESKQKYEDIILHHINEEAYSLALEKMKKLHGDDLKKELIYRHCHILMKEVTEETLDFVQKNLFEFELTRLIPGFMNVPHESMPAATEFLWHYCTETTTCKEKSIHNIYIFFLSEQRDEDELDEYLNKQEEMVTTEETGGYLFDLEFALQNFKKQDLVKAQIKVYGMMGLYADAITLALERNMIAEAKALAAKPEGSTTEAEDLRKNLWLQIAQHLIKTKEIEPVIQLTRDSNNIIKIQDLLPQFDDNSKIELFKNDIVDSLKNYVDIIKRLKSDLSSFEKNSEYLKGELRGLKNRYIEIKGDHKCEECTRSIFVEEFYIFPCGHGYHKSCLKNKMTELNVYPEKLAEVEVLEKKMQALLGELNQTQNTKKTTFLDAFNPFNLTKETFLGGEKKGPNPQPTQLDNQIRQTRERIDFLLAGECLGCGKYLIDAIIQGFDPSGEARKQWDV